MQSNALWMLDGQGGAEAGSLLATASDFHRLGTWLIDVLADTDHPLHSWVSESTSPQAPGEPGYGYAWWLTNPGLIEAHGAYGQLLRIDTIHRRVTVVLSHLEFGNSRIEEELLSVIEQRWP